jgi:hypothetical protein
MWIPQRLRGRCWIGIFCRTRSCDLYSQSVPLAAQIAVASASRSGSDFVPSVQTDPFQYITPARRPFLQYTSHAEPSLPQPDPFRVYADAGDAEQASVARAVMMRSLFTTVSIE